MTITPEEKKRIQEIFDGKKPRVFELNGDLHSGRYDETFAPIDEAMADNRKPNRIENLVIDAEGVTGIQGAASWRFIELSKNCRQRGGIMLVVGMDQRIVDGFADVELTYRNEDGDYEGFVNFLRPRQKSSDSNF